MKKNGIEILVEAAGVLILVVSMVVIHNFLAATGVVVAAIFISSTMDKMRNRLGNNVFSQNHSANFIRLWVRPRNPKSPAQMGSRGAFTEISRRWRTLTPFIQTEWNKYAMANPVTNNLGVQVYITGFNWFLKVNIPLQYMGLEIKLVPCTINQFVAPIYGECETKYDANTGLLNSFKVNYTNTDDFPNVYFEVFMSQKLSGGITSALAASYRYSVKIPRLLDGQIDLTEAIATTAGFWRNTDTDQCVYFKIRQINTDWGTTDTWQYIRYWIHNSITN